MTKDESYPYSVITLPAPTSSSPTNPGPKENPHPAPSVLSTRSYNRSASKEHHDCDDSFGFEGQVTVQRDAFGEIVGIVLDPYWTDGGPIPAHHHMEVVGRVRFVDQGDGC